MDSSQPEIMSRGELDAILASRNPNADVFHFDAVEGVTGLIRLAKRGGLESKRSSPGFLVSSLLSCTPKEYHPMLKDIMSKGRGVPEDYLPKLRKLKAYLEEQQKAQRRS